MTQPEALRLADFLEDVLHDWTCAHDAAAELRRLYAVCVEWEAKAEIWLSSPAAVERLQGYRELAQRLDVAEAQHDALLEALQLIADVGNRAATEISRAAIAKAEEKT